MPTFDKKLKRICIVLEMGLKVFMGGDASEQNNSLPLKYVKELVENMVRGACQIWCFSKLLLSLVFIVLQSGDSFLSRYKACSSNCQQAILMLNQYIDFSMANPGNFFALKLR